MQIDADMLDMRLADLSDEPTNHLDPETQAIIGGNFNMYSGTIIVVSHNPPFVEQIGISRMLILPSGRIEEFSRELLEYYYDLNTMEEEHCTCRDNASNFDSTYRNGILNTRIKLHMCLSA